MLYATLLCTDEDCAETVEVWGELDALTLVLCDGCDCLMQIIDVSESEPAPLVHLPLRAHQRRAA
jgi:hypothetical protein